MKTKNIGKKVLATSLMTSVLFTGVSGIPTIAFAQDNTPNILSEVQNHLPNIKILATGGTIAGAGSSSTQTTGYKAGVLGVDALIQAVPEIKKVANVSGEQVANIDSSAMTNEILLKLAKKVNEELAKPDVDGIVITHGTDTLEETAYFLNLVVKSDKPVVLVGAMRPATAMSADGPLNLYNAVALAASKEAMGKGVLVALNEKIASARDVTKTNTTSVETFKSPDFGYMGYIIDGKPYFYYESTRLHTTQTEFDISNINQLPRVDIVYGHGNDSRDLVDAAVKAGAKGIIHAGIGDGSVYPETLQGLLDAEKQGVVVVRSTNVGSGITTHETSDDTYHFVTSDSLNPKKARILLMLALTKTNDPAQIQEMFNKY